MPSDRIASDTRTAKNCSSSGIYVRQLFRIKEQLYTELSIFSSRDKFEFKVDRS